MHLPDLSSFVYRGEAYGSTAIENPLNAIAIGWLGSTVPLSGVLAPHFLIALKLAYSQHKVDEGWLGWHCCEICQTHKDRGEFIIRIDELNYIVPSMVLHYIEEHDYLPPRQFLADLERWWEQHHNGA